MAMPSLQVEKAGVNKPLSAMVVGVASDVVYGMRASLRVVTST